MTKTHTISTIVVALHVAWTEAQPASAESTNMQRLTALLESGTVVRTMMSGKDLSETGRVTIHALLINQNELIEQLGDETCEDILELLTAIRGYSKLVRERAAPTATDDEWLRAIESAVRRGKADGCLPGERWEYAPLTELFRRDLRSIIEPLTRAEAPFELGAEDIS